MTVRPTEHQLQWDCLGSRGSLLLDPPFLDTSHHWSSYICAVTGMRLLCRHVVCLDVGRAACRHVENRWSHSPGASRLLFLPLLAQSECHRFLLSRRALEAASNAVKSSYYGLYNPPFDGGLFCSMAESSWSCRWIPVQLQLLLHALRAGLLRS